MVAPAAHSPCVDDVVAAHAALRRRRPLVQCLSNAVSVNFMANVLLAAGAAPAMVDNPQEAASFAGVADAVLVNLGTPTLAQVEAMRLVTSSAQDAGRPWVLDPVGAGGLPWRGAIAAELLDHRPAIVRGNASEIIGLAGLGGGARGVDSSAESSQAVNAAVLLLDYATAVSASGPVDHVVGRIVCHERARVGLIRVSGGSPFLPRVTATGCALGALAAAYASVASDPLAGLVAAHVHFAVAAELAEQKADGPGSFAVAFLDAIDHVDERALRERARIEPVCWME